MPNPKKKHTRHRTGIRRASNWTMKVEAANVSSCPSCGKPRLPHRACGSCGFYAGRLVISPKIKKTNDKQGPNQPQ